MKLTFRLAILVFGLALALGLASNYAFFNHHLGLNGPAVTVLVMVAIMILARATGRPRPATWIWGALTFFSVMVAVHTSPLLTALNVLACVILGLLWLQQVTGHRLRTFQTSTWFLTAALPVRFIEPAASVLGAMVSLKGADSKHHAVIRQVLVGVAVALPLLFVFTVLFASADAAFEEFVSGLLRVNLNFDVVFQLWFVTVITLALTGAFGYWLTGPMPVRTNAADNVSDDEDDPSPAPKMAPAEWRPFGLVETSVALGLVSGLFLVFIGFQLHYLFGNAAIMLAKGMTYADYARRGFFELLVVAVLSLVVVLVAERLVRRPSGNHGRMFKLIGSSLALEVLVIMGSAFKRLWLYEEAYGFSTLRLYSHAFTLFLAVIFVLVLVKLWRSGETRRFILQVVVVGLFWLAFVNAANPDALIARFNITRFHTTGKLDTEYLASLSSDAVPELTALATGSNDDGRRLVEQLKLKYPANYRPDWQEWNLADAQAADALSTTVIK